MDQFDRTLLIVFAWSGLLYAQAPKTGQLAGAETFLKPSSCASCRADIHIDTTLVQVPVRVEDRRGGFIQGLPVEAFHVFENGIEERVTSFSGDDAAVSVGMIFDMSGSMEAKLPTARRAVEQFLKSASVEDEFFLRPFDALPRSATAFTHDVKTILGDVARGDANGSTALLDAV